MGRKKKQDNATLPLFGEESLAPTVTVAEKAAKPTVTEKPKKEKKAKAKAKPKVPQERWDLAAKRIIRNSSRRKRRGLSGS